MLWEFLKWAGPPVALGILSNILTPCARRALKKYSDKTRTLLARLGSKIYTSLSEISFLALAKRKLTAFAQIVVVGACRLAILCLWAVAIYHQVNRITEGANTVRASTVTATDSRSCYCPKGNVYSSTTTLSKVTRPNCGRVNYSATPISFTTDGTKLLGDTSPAGTGRYGGSGYSIDDEPR